MLYEHLLDHLLYLSSLKGENLTEKKLSHCLTKNKWSCPNIDEGFAYFLNAHVTLLKEDFLHFL